MIASVIRYSLQNRISVLFCTAIICILGLRAIHLTPVDAIPDLSDVQVIIKTRYPGQAPSVVEQQVTHPLTSALMSVPGAKTVRGFSFYGDSYIYVIFEDGTDIYWARSRVLEYLSQIKGELPVEAVPQLGPDASGVGWVYIYALQDLTGQHDLAQLRSLQDWLLKYELQSVPGVAEVAAVGGMIKQYQVLLDPQKLQFYNIPLNHIRNAIQRSNQESGLSVIELAEAEYMLRATGYIEGAKELLEIPIGFNVQGTPILLSHVAQVVESPEMRRGVAELNGRGEVVGGIIVMRHGENADNTITKVKQKLKLIKRSLPASVDIVPVYDRSTLIKRSINNLWVKVTQELVLVALVMFGFLLCVRSVLVAMVTIPVGILMSFVVMQAQGVNANIMSLGGIAIAIGTMVDGAIVMVENVHRKFAADTSKARWQTVYDSVIEVGPTLFFSLVIITVSFMPVFALEAEEGRLFRPLALTKTYAMAGAAALSITLIPVLLYYLLGKNRTLTGNSSPMLGGLYKVYRPLLHMCLSRPRTMIVVALLGIALTAIPLKRLSSEFMPPLDEGGLMYMPTTFPGISVGKARELLQQTDKLILSVPEVLSVFGKAGRADTATDPAPLTMIESFIQLKPRSQWRKGMTTASIIQELEQKISFPGLSNAWVMPIKTRIDMLATGMKTPLGIKLAGESIEVLQQLAIEVEQVLSSLSDTQSVYAERTAGGRYLTIDINRAEAARYGLTIADIHEWLQLSVGGVAIGEAVEGGKRYPISMRFPDQYRDTPERLLELPIISREGVQVRLSDVADLAIETGAALLKSENGRINNWVFLDIGDASVESYAQSAEQALLNEINWPSGYTMSWSGQYQSIKRVKERMLFIVPLTLCSIAMLLFISFGRCSDVLIILLTLPFSLVGGLLLVFFLDYKISVAVIVGFIALAGLAVETGSIMLQVLRSNVGAAVASSVKLKHEIEVAASQRLRPVLMTAVATIAGLLPIMVGQEPGSEMMSRIAAPVIGGLATSVILTLFVIPGVFYIVKQKQSPGL